MGVQHFAMNPPQKHFATEIKFVNPCLSIKKKGEKEEKVAHMQLLVLFMLAFGTVSIIMGKGKLFKVMLHTIWGFIFSEFLPCLHGYCF